MGKLIYGVALNDSGYPTVKYWRGVSGKKHIVWRCPFFASWKQMIERCYSESYSKRPAYSDCLVCDDWLVFSKFKRWMEDMDWKGRCLDKDLIFVGNKIYGPETSRFILQSTNNLIVIRPPDRDLPKGVSIGGRGKPYRAMCSNPETGKNISIGSFNCYIDAHYAWVKQKTEFAKQAARVEVDLCVVKSLQDYFLRASVFYYPELHEQKRYPDKE